MLLAATWSDFGVALTIALVGSAVAAVWPRLVVTQRRRRFQGLIKRELEEIGPYPKQPDDQPWWHHLTKRFVHEEIFARHRISENRDFILSLDPTVTYHVGQLWIAFDKRDLEQWQYHVSELAANRQVGSEKAGTAAAAWQEFAAPTGEAASTRVRGSAPATSGTAGELFEARLAAYAGLLALTRALPDSPRPSSAELTDWYYTGANGLLLSGDALRAFRTARKALKSAVEKDVDNAMTKLRTELKIDLGVRHPDERDVPFARPLDRRSF